MFSRIIIFIMLAVVMVIPTVHIVLIAIASMEIYQTDWNAYAKLLLISSAALINIGGLAMIFGMNKDFDFFEVEQPAEQKSKADIKGITSD